jgi:hypothetical protein
MNNKEQDKVVDDIVNNIDITANIHDSIRDYFGGNGGRTNELYTKIINKLISELKNSI